MSSILAPVDLAPATVRGHEALARSITRAASTQTYYTILFLADRDRAADAYRAYAYFRWVDDRLDDGAALPAERAAFLARQQTLLNAGYAGRSLPAGLAPEEALLAELIAADTEPDSGLRSYLRNMMAVMAFDVGRRGTARRETARQEAGRREVAGRGRISTEAELAKYSRLLATAVGDALFHFIGHDQQPPRDPARYAAIRGAHIIHMLRDMAEDVANGYVNLPAEFLAANSLLTANGLTTDDLDAALFDRPAFRDWVAGRVALARRDFAAGRELIGGLSCRRCRLAGYAYIARFEYVAGLIERDDFRLRPAYPERKSLGAALAMGMKIIRN